jgi:hypothetical protein
VAHRVDPAGREELVGDLGRLVHEAARIAPDVEEDAADDAPLRLGAHLRGRRHELRMRALLELLDAEVRDVAVEELVENGRDVDHLACELERERRAGALGRRRITRRARVGVLLLQLPRVLLLLRSLHLAQHGDLHLAARAAAHALHDLVERLTEDILTVDRDDLIAALDPGALRG